MDNTDLKEPDSLDWDNMWNSRRKALREARLVDCGSLWSNKQDARRYHNITTGKQEERVKLILQDIPVFDNCRVLDIGSGPGTLTIPLAAMAEYVTAVEPASGMRGVLRELAREKGVENIREVSKRWEDTLPEDLEPPYDVVVSSFALGMEDLRESLIKMSAVCRGSVHLFWFVGETSWQAMKRRVWPELHGKVIPAPHKTDIIYNILFQLGHPVEVKRYSYTFYQDYSSVEELLEQNRKSFALNTPELEQRFLEIVLPTLQSDGASFRSEGYAQFAGYTWPGTWSGTRPGTSPPAPGQAPGQAPSPVHK